MTYLSTASGPIMSPFDGFLVRMSVKTLPLRTQRACLNAQPVAEFLEKHPGIGRVYYPERQSHPQHRLAGRQMAGFGAMISVVVRVGLESARQLLERTQIFPLAKNLGGVENLIEHPAITPHASVPRSVRHKIGIVDALVRLSVGVDTLDAINNDLAAALDTL